MKKILQKALIVTGILYAILSIIKGTSLIQWFLSTFPSNSNFVVCKGGIIKPGFCEIIFTGWIVLFGSIFLLVYLILLAIEKIKKA